MLNIWTYYFTKSLLKAFREQLPICIFIKIRTTLTFIHNTNIKKLCFCSPPTFKGVAIFTSLSTVLQVANNTDDKAAALLRLSARCSNTNRLSSQKTTVHQQWCREWKMTYSAQGFGASWNDLGFCYKAKH